MVAPYLSFKQRAGREEECVTAVFVVVLRDKVSFAVRHRDRIRPLYLPASAPGLNLFERVWRHRKDTLSNYRWSADLPALERATASLLHRMEARVRRPQGTTLRPVPNLCETA